MFCAIAVFVQLLLNMSGTICFTKERSKFILSLVLFQDMSVKKGRKMITNSVKVNIILMFYFFPTIFSKIARWSLDPLVGSQTCTRICLASIFNITHVPVVCKEDCYERRDNGAKFPFWSTLIAAVNQSGTQHLIIHCNKIFWSPLSHSGDL